MDCYWAKWTICPLAIFRALHKRDLFLAIFSTITCSFWGFDASRPPDPGQPLNVCRSRQFLAVSNLIMAAFLISPKTKISPRCRCLCTWTLSCRQSACSLCQPNNPHHASQSIVLTTIAIPRAIPHPASSRIPFHPRLPTIDKLSVTAPITSLDPEPWIPSARRAQPAVRQGTMPCSAQMTINIETRGKEPFLVPGKSPTWRDIAWLSFANKQTMETPMEGSANTSAHAHSLEPYLTCAHHSLWNAG